MEPSQVEQSPPPRNDELSQSRESLEEVMRLAVQAAELHAAREQARLAAQTVAEGRRSETEPRRPIGTQDEIALLKSELDHTKDLGMRLAATAKRLGSEVNGLKSDLKLSQEQILEAIRHGDMADAQRQEAQAALARSNEQLTQNNAEIITLRAQLDTARQDAADQAERLQIALRRVEEFPLRYEHEELRIREDLERTLQENARLRDERRAVEVDLERAHAALQEKDRALNDALLLVTLTETAAKASELELLRMHGPGREWLAHSNAQRRR